MAPSVEKKIAELEMGLLHLQQNIDIPEINLVVHPVVANVINKCADEKRKPKVADFGDKAEDPQFLNALQNGVNKWIKEIQKVQVSITEVISTSNKLNCNVDVLEATSQLRMGCSIFSVSVSLKCKQVPIMELKKDVVVQHNQILNRICPVTGSKAHEKHGNSFPGNRYQECTMYKIMG